MLDFEILSLASLSMDCSCIAPRTPTNLEQDPMFPLQTPLISYRQFEGEIYESKHRSVLIIAKLEALSPPQILRSL